MTEKQLVHIRLPQKLHTEVKQLATGRGSSLQAVIEEAIGQGLTANSVEPSVNLRRVFDSRFSTRLAEDLEEACRRATTLRFMGLNLLDFLSEDGWGQHILSIGLSDGAKVRLLIQDKDSHSSVWRLEQLFGADAEDSSSLRNHPRRLAYEQAESYIRSLVGAHPNATARRFTIYPLVRWMVLSDSALFIEHHCPRAHLERPTSAGKLPVFEFARESGSGERYSEYFEAAWDTGVSF